MNSVKEGKWNRRKWFPTREATHNVQYPESREYLAMTASPQIQVAAHQTLKRISVYLQVGWA